MPEKHQSPVTSHQSRIKEPSMAQHKTTNTGHVVQVIGPVIDVQFPEHHLPEIHNAARITSERFKGPEPINIVAEGAQHLGEGRVRTVGMTATEGVLRRMKGVDLWGRIAVSVDNHA